MKILLINKFFYTVGGGETYFFALAEALQKAGHQVVFFSMKHARNYPCKQSRYFVETVDYNPKKLRPAHVKSAFKLIYSREAMRKLEALIKQEKPDIAHLNLIHRQLSFSVVDVLYKYRIPMVHTMHDYIIACPDYVMRSPRGFCEACVGGHYWHCIQNKCVKDSILKSMVAAVEAYFLKWTHKYDKINAFIAPSVFMYTKMKEAGFTKRPVLFMRNFMPPDIACKRCAQDEGYFLFFGRLSREKGILTLLEAVRPLKDVRLLLAGDGPQREEIETFIRENGMGGRVEMLGFQERARVARTIERCRCAIIPSEFYENCPYAAIEAMAKGNPVIGSDLGGLPEFIEDGITGRVFPQGDADSLRDAIREINAMSAESRAAMGAAGLQRVKEMTNSDRYIDELTRLYTAVIEEEKRVNA